VAEIQDAYKLLSPLLGKCRQRHFPRITCFRAKLNADCNLGWTDCNGRLLELRLSPWLRRLVTRLIAIVPALIAIIFFGERVQVAYWFSAK